MPTFDHGIPCKDRPIVTPYGLATVKTFHENGTVDIYVGGGRTFTVPGSTLWREAKR
jgi:hypothetical protein